MADYKFMRQNNWDITLSVEGTNEPLGRFSRKEGGNTSSEPTVTMPGGAEPAVVIPGGKGKAGEAITVGRQFDQNRDAGSAYDRFKRLEGSGTVVVLAQQPLDYDGVAFGQPITDRCLVVGVEAPPADANSEELTELVVQLQPFGKKA